MVPGPSEPSTERVFIRTVAGASRKLDEDLSLSPLQAIDRLHKMNAKFRQHWIHFPWLVLEDGTKIAANMPVPQMLSEIEKYGQPIGMAGVALLKEAQRYTTFKMMFRKDEKRRKVVEGTAEKALRVFTERISRMNDLFDSLPQGEQ